MTRTANLYLLCGLVLVLATVSCNAKFTDLRPKADNSTGGIDVGADSAPSHDTAEIPDGVGDSSLPPDTSASEDATPDTSQPSDLSGTLEDLTQVGDKTVIDTTADISTPDDGSTLVDTSPDTAEPDTDPVDVPTVQDIPLVEDLPQVKDNSPPVNVVIAQGTFKGNDHYPSIYGDAKLIKKPDGVYLVVENLVMANVPGPALILANRDMLSGGLDPNKGDILIVALTKPFPGGGEWKVPGVNADLTQRYIIPYCVPFEIDMGGGILTDLP